MGVGLDSVQKLKGLPSILGSGLVNLAGEMAGLFPVDPLGDGFGFVMAVLFAEAGLAAWPAFLLGIGVALLWEDWQKNVVPVLTDPCVIGS